MQHLMSQQVVMIFAWKDICLSALATHSRPGSGMFVIYPIILCTWMLFAWQILVRTLQFVFCLIVGEWFWCLCCCILLMLCACQKAQCEIRWFQWNLSLLLSAALLSLFTTYQVEITSVVTSYMLITNCCNHLIHFIKMGNTSVGY